MTLILITAPILIAAAAILAWQIVLIRRDNRRYEEIKKMYDDAPGKSDTDYV